MKTLTIVFLFLFISAASFAQTYAPIRNTGLLVKNLSFSNDTTTKFILLNFDGDLTEEDCYNINATFGGQKNKKIMVGISVILSYFGYNTPFFPANIVNTLNDYLNWASKYNLPIVLVLDGEADWTNRPDLWNWWASTEAEYDSLHNGAPPLTASQWDSTKGGYNPENRYNVEWTDWTPDSATKGKLLNWGSPVKLPPPPNLMSPTYIAACHKEMTMLVGIIKTWWNNLPEDKKYLFVGIIVGWETGSNFYENGFNQPPDIGYAAVSTLGLAHSGKLTEEQLTEVARIHLEDLSKVCYDLGIPRDHIFTHGGGPGGADTIMFTAAVNKYSCPGWSFYQYAYDPAKELAAMNALNTSDAPYWAAPEWYPSATTEEGWVSAFQKTFEAGAHFLCIYSYNSGVKTNRNALEAISQMLIITGVKQQNGQKPTTFALSQNYPNPFNPTTQIKYSVPQNGLVTLKVYNVLGQEVTTLFSGMQRPGNYVATFDGSKYASGVYFYTLHQGTNSITKKLLLLK